MTPEIGKMKAVPTSTPRKRCLEYDADSPRGGEAKRTPTVQDRIFNNRPVGGVTGIERLEDV